MLVARIIATVAADGASETHARGVRALIPAAVVAVVLVRVLVRVTA
jgi:hypothetical protein